MDQSPPPQDDTRFLIDEASDLIGWLIGEIADLLSLHIRPERKMWRSILNHFILPAEAALRRVVHLIAASLPAPEPGKAPPPRKTKRGAKAAQTESTSRAPSFRLTEPLPRPKTDYLPVNQCPRIRFLDEPTRREPLRPARAPFDLALYDAQLRRRIAALDLSAYRTIDTTLTYAGRKFAELAEAESAAHAFRLTHNGDIVGEYGDLGDWPHRLERAFPDDGVVLVVAAASAEEAKAARASYLELVMRFVEAPD